MTNHIFDRIAASYITIIGSQVFYIVFEIKTRFSIHIFPLKWLNNITVYLSFHFASIRITKLYAENRTSKIELKKCKEPTDSTEFYGLKDRLF